MSTDSDLDGLREQRDFLLRSLDDLEREHDAGDVDEHDYLTLKDDYTARAARVLRALERGDSARPRVRRSWRRVVLTTLAVGAFAVVAGLLVAQTAGRRDAGEVITGDIRRSTTEKLNEAGRRAGEGDYAGAVSLYDEVLADQPTHPEALTYKGWILTLDGQREEGLTALLDAATANPTYPDVHAFLSIVFYRSGLVDEAARELTRLDALDPPADIRQLVEPLRAEIEATQDG